MISLEMPASGYSPTVRFPPIGVPLVPVGLIGIYFDEMKSKSKLRASSFSTKFSRTFLLSAPLRSSFETRILWSVVFFLFSSCF